MNTCLFRSSLAGLLWLGLCPVAVQAQVPASPGSAAAAPIQNVMQLSASGQVEVQQDWLTLSLGATHEGADAASVQAELRKALEAALAQVKGSAQPGQMDVRTGDFSIYPRHGRDGKLSGWQGRAELILEGRDVARITQAAARAGSMTIGHLAFSLSREQRARVEGEAQAQAIARFRARAGEIAQAFGFAGYTLREVSISGDGDDMAPRMFGMARDARPMAAAAAAPVPVEPGRSSVRVTVSGSVQAH